MMRMLRSKRQILIGAITGVFLSLAGTDAACGVEAPVDGGERREPFSPPRTEAELRWLMDQSEAQRFQFIEGTEEEPRAVIEPGFQWPEGVAPELQRIQQELGGPAVEQFPSLRGAKPQAAGERPTSARRQEVSALRDAAAQLDEIANRLERLELYEQADALRKQAQRMRLDARGMMEAPRPMPLGGAPWESDSARRTVPIWPDNRQKRSEAELPRTVAPE